VVSSMKTLKRLSILLEPKCANAEIRSRRPWGIRSAVLVIAVAVFWDGRSSLIPTFRDVFDQLVVPNSWVHPDDGWSSVAVVAAHRFSSILIGLPWDSGAWFVCVAFTKPRMAAAGLTLHLLKLPCSAI